MSQAYACARGPGLATSLLLATGDCRAARNRRSRRPLLRLREEGREKDQRVNRNKYEGSCCKTARDNSLPSWACLIREKFRVPDVKDFSFYLFLLCIFCAKLWKNRNN